MTAASPTSRCVRSTIRCLEISPIPPTRRLWALHRQRLITSLERLQLAPPRSDLPRRDPWALRAALLLVLVVALVHGRGEIGPRLLSGFTFTGRPAVGSIPPAVDLWITPPAYTRRRRW